MRSDVSRTGLQTGKWSMVCDALFVRLRAFGDGQAQSPDATGLLWRVTKSRDIDCVTLLSVRVGSTLSLLSADDGTWCVRLLIKTRNACIMYRTARSETEHSAVVFIGFLLYAGSPSHSDADCNSIHKYCGYSCVCIICFHEVLDYAGWEMLFSVKTMKLVSFWWCTIMFERKWSLSYAFLSSSL